MAHEIKDSGHKLEEVMAAAGYQHKKQQEEEEKAARRKKTVGTVVRSVLLLVVVGSLAGGYVYRDEVKAVVDNYTDTGVEAEEAEEESAAVRMNRNLEYATQQAEKRDSILDEIHSKGMAE